MKPGVRSKAGQGAITRKIARLRSGKPLRVLDLFSGCGGISLGFQGAGFQIDAAVELDELAAETHARNFHGQLAPEMVARHAKSRDTQRRSRSTPEGTFNVRGAGAQCGPSLSFKYRLSVEA